MRGGGTSPHEVAEEGTGGHPTRQLSAHHSEGAHDEGEGACRGGVERCCARAYVMVVMVVVTVAVLLLLLVVVVVVAWSDCACGVRARCASWGRGVAQRDACGHRGRFTPATPAQATVG